MLFHTMAILWYSVWHAWNHTTLGCFYDLHVTINFYGTFYDFHVFIDHHTWLSMISMFFFVWWSTWDPLVADGLSTTLMLTTFVNLPRIIVGCLLQFLFFLHNSKTFVIIAPLLSHLSATRMNIRHKISVHAFWLSSIIAVLSIILLSGLKRY